MGGEMALAWLREGLRELGRKIRRVSLKRSIGASGRKHSEKLQALGMRAWELGVNKDEHGDTAQLISLAERQEKASAEKFSALEQKKKEIEERKAGEAAKFGSRIHEVEGRKRPVDTTLAAEKNSLSSARQEDSSARNRLKIIAADIEKLKGSSPPQGMDAETVSRKIDGLSQEKKAVEEKLIELAQAIKAHSDGIAPLEKQSRALQSEIDRIAGERKKAMAGFDGEISALKKEMDGVMVEGASAGKLKLQRFAELGGRVAASGRADPAVMQEMSAVKAAEEERNSLQLDMEGLLYQTRSMPAGTMPKLYGLIAFLLILATGSVYGYTSLKGNSVGAKWVSLTKYFMKGNHAKWAEGVEAIKPPNPYAKHPLSNHSAYLLANKLTEAKNEQEVANLMREVFQKIHLGVYTADGQQILAGAERGEKDMFIYDFQLKILARAFYLRNVMAFSDHSRMLGKALIELEKPDELKPILIKAVVRRYKEALQKPDDPMSFLILLADGLARQQAEPYSLDDDYRFSRDRTTYIDPLQSFLIMLDFFTRPPATKATVNLNWAPSFVSTAHAQSPCGMIEGDDSQGYWGRGTDIFTEIGQNISGIGGAIIGGIGNVTGITGAIGDLLVLYGMTIELKPQPRVIHLLHNEGFIAGIEATVAFDGQGVSDSILKCGWLAGKQMPSNGPLKDVDLTWNFRPSLQPYLEMHREMFYGYRDGRNILPGVSLTGVSGGLRTTTDENGKSMFLIQPKECLNKQGGVLRRKDYWATVDTRYVTKSIPTPGMLGWGLLVKLGPGTIEYLMNGRSGKVLFTAEWHAKPRDYSSSPMPLRNFDETTDGIGSNSNAIDEIKKRMMQNYYQSGGR